MVPDKKILQGGGLPFYRAVEINEGRKLLLWHPKKKRGGGGVGGGGGQARACLDEEQFSSDLAKEKNMFVFP